MTLVISKGITLRKGWQPMDADAAAYITAVETADGQVLEEKTKIAIDNFVLGCKADGIWSAIKASCILAGARTLTGALVPLVGAAPTNVSGNFVAGNYNRKTGLVGDGSTKYLDSNYGLTGALQSSNHAAVWVSTFDSGNAKYYLGALNNNLHLHVGASSAVCRNLTSAQIFGGGIVNGTLQATARSSSTNYVFRHNRVTINATGTAQSIVAANVILFGQSASTALSTGRLAFYSIGESLDLALLDARVTDLINAFGAAIP